MTLPVYTFSDCLTDARVFINDIKQDDGSCTYSDAMLLRILMGLGSKIAALDVSPSTETQFNSVALQQAYVYPSDTFWWPKQGFILYCGIWVPLPFNVLTNISQVDLFSSSITGVPDLFYILDGEINLYPIPDQAYPIKIISEKRFPELDTGAGLSTTLALSFFAYFDPAYKDICWRYIRMMIQQGKNEKNSMECYRLFFDASNSQSDWRFIVNVEKNKYEFNAKNRRAGGDVMQNYSDYSSGGGSLG